jgi:antitoxin component of MazEF toxin-antitoxin module
MNSLRRFNADRFYADPVSGTQQPATGDLELPEGLSSAGRFWVLDDQPSDDYPDSRYDFDRSWPKMTTQIVRVGNTLTVEIPEEIAAQASLAAGDPVEWVAQGSASIALVKRTEGTVGKLRRRITLEEILQGIPDNAEMENVDWGTDRGAEIW